MKDVKSKRIFKVLISMMLLATLILLTEPKVQAAQKAEINTEFSMGTGSTPGFDYYYYKGAKYTLEVYYPVKSATYSFSSSNKNVVTVKTSGTTAYLTGVKAGTATITCNQTLKGKTTKVGTCKVTVKDVSCILEGNEVLPLGTSTASSIWYFDRNFDATYTFSSNSKDFTVKEDIKINKELVDDVYFISQTFTAKKPGTYTVTIKETYNKVTRTVAKLKYKVKKATVMKKETIELGGEDIWAFNLINNYRYDTKYLFECKDDKILDTYVQNGTVYLKGKSKGKATLNIYENATKPDKSKLIGTCIITVKEVVLEDLDYNFYETETYVDGSEIQFEVYKNPYNAPGTIKVKSSDPSVATVKIDEYGYGTITPVGEGTTTITITCGKITKTETITVYADDEY